MSFGESFPRSARAYGTANVRGEDVPWGDCESSGIIHVRARAQSVIAFDGVSEWVGSDESLGPF